MKKLRQVLAGVLAIACLTASTCATSASCKRNPDGSIECSVSVDGHKHQE